MSSIHALAAATDSAIAEINGRISRQQRIISSSFDSITQAERSIARDIANGRTPSARPYGIDVDECQAKIDAANFEIEYLRSEAAPFHAVYAEHRWSRFYLVTNTNGHVHSSTGCGTCFPTTEFNWLTELSGLTEAEAVAAYGEILCSVCFPSAPVEWTNGESKATKTAKAERDAKKAERLAKKLAKALVPEDIDGGLVIDTGCSYSERITTISAAKAWLTDSVEYNCWFPRQFDDGSFQLNADGSVQQYHPSYPPAAIALVADVLADRIDSTPEAEIAAAQKRAAKRR